MADQRQFLLSRADYRCEYCRCEISQRQYEIEHIIPRDKGGTNNVENYAIACGECNSRKGTATRARDANTWELRPLFHPRKDSHAEHFRMMGGDLVGRTPTGRATAALLFRSTPQLIARDLKWSPLLDLRPECGLYSLMNDLRAKQMRNDFSVIDFTLENDPCFRRADPEDQLMAREAFILLLAELCMLRAGVGDIQRGLNLVRAYQKVGTRRPMIRSELFALESILLKQAATTLALQRNQQLSSRYQEIAARRFNQMMNLRGEDFMLPEFSHWKFRLLALLNRFQSPQESLYNQHDLKNAIAMAEDTQRPDALIPLADVELALRRPSRLAEPLLEKLERVLLEVGYGQDANYAPGVAVRRRWWELRMRIGADLDERLLKEDVAFWKRISMSNEWRSLQLNQFQGLPDAKDAILSVSSVFASRK